MHRRDSNRIFQPSGWKLVKWGLVPDKLAEVKNDPIAGYTQPCNEDNEVCDYVDMMQEQEHTPS